MGSATRIAISIISWLAIKQALFGNSSRDFSIFKGTYKTLPEKYMSCELYESRCLAAVKFASEANMCASKIKKLRCFTNSVASSRPVGISSGPPARMSFDLKLALSRAGYTGDFLKSSTKCGGYTRDNFVDSSKIIQQTEISRFPLTILKNREKKIARVAAALSMECHAS